MSQTPSPSAEERIARLDERLRQLEDQVAIYQLLASYAPAVDSRARDATGELWAEDGRYDFGAAPLVGREDVGRLVDREPHVGYVARGCAHVISMPLVRVEGDTATATGYSRIYLRDGDAWRIERASANRWELVRTAAGWKVANRLNRPLDGSPEARGLLAAGIARPTAPKAAP